MHTYLCIFVVIICQTWNINIAMKIEFKRLMNEYLLACGPQYMCYPDKWLKLGIQYIANCPTCFCDNQCMSRGDCCPDIFFSFPYLECHDVTMMKSSDALLKEKEQPLSYLIVKSCPPETSTELNNNCTKNHSSLIDRERILDPVVSSSTQQVSFKNTYCALCNAVTHTNDWNLDIDCLRFADFNFLSTYKDIIELANERDCTVKFSQATNTSMPCIINASKPSTDIIRKCNITQSWGSQIQEIQTACEHSSYDLNHGHFKNIFCKMCNPSPYTNDIISTCNTTDTWKKRDISIENACAEFNSTESTRPFKNVFCFLCNKNNVSGTNFNDANVIIRDSSDATYTSLDITIQQFNADTYIGQLQTHIENNVAHSDLKVEADYGSISTFRSSASIQNENRCIHNTSTPSIDLNLTTILQSYMSWFPENKLCRSDVIHPRFYVYQDYFRPCECSPACIFSTEYEQCCLDTVLTYPMRCLDHSIIRLDSSINGLPEAQFIKKAKLSTFKQDNLQDLKLHIQRQFTGIKHTKMPVLRNATQDILLPIGSSKLRKTSEPKHRRKSNFIGTISIQPSKLIRKATSKSRNQIKTHKKRIHRILRHEETIITTAGCWHTKENTPVSCRCISNTVTDIFSLLPVYDTITGIVYKSLDCYICNQRTSNRKNQMNYQTIRELLQKHKLGGFKISIYCSKVINFGDFLVFYDFLSMLKKEKCTLRYNQQSNDRYIRQICPSTNTLDYVSSCNQTGQWTRYDRNIQYACEYPNTNVGLSTFRKYKNVFCYLCNEAPHPFIELIDTCNVTGRWMKYDQNIVDACQLFPRVSVWIPYKNWFCRACNEMFGARETTKGPGRNFMVVGDQGISPPDRVFRSFRSIFSLDALNDIDIEPTTVCDNGTFVGTRKKPCRPTLCFPGRVLKLGKCIPLLRYTNNLRYTLAFKLIPSTDIAVFSKNIDTGFSLLQGTIEDTLKRTMETTYLLVEEITFIAEKSLCTNSKTTSQDLPAILVNVRFFVEGFIHRLDAEKHLLEMANERLHIKHEGISMEFAIVFDVEAALTPTFMSVGGTDIYCARKYSSDHTFVPDETPRNIYVTRLLECLQVELEDEEFSLQWGNLSIYLQHTNRTFDVNQYHLLDKGLVRICVEDASVDALNAEPNPKVTGRVENLLGQVSIICTSVSSMCLVFTFITYCIFRTLHSIPGINIMSIVFSLFCSQIFLQFGLYFSLTTDTCKSIGIITHYFWLTLFSSMSISSFHMYHVFVGAGSMHAIKSHVTVRNRRLCVYLVISYGIPLIILVLNIISSSLVGFNASSFYGGSDCFITNRTSYIVSFLTPIISSCVLDIAFFALTVHKLRTMPKLSPKRENSDRFYIFLKLFVITGIAWLLVIIDSFLDISVLSFVVTFINGLQGVYIFVSYVCNRRILNLYLNLFSRKPKRTLHSVPKTDSTSAPPTNESSSQSEHSVFHQRSSRNGSKRCFSIPSIEEDSLYMSPRFSVDAGSPLSSTVSTIHNLSGISEEHDVTDTDINTDGFHSQYLSSKL